MQLLIYHFCKEEHSMADLKIPAIKQMMSRLNVQNDAATNRAKIERVRER